MVERKTSTRRYIVAGLITILVFCIGLLLGITLTDAQGSAIAATNDQQKLDSESAQLQYLLLSGLRDPEQGCPAALKTLEININAVEDTRKKLESYIGSSIKENDDLTRLKRDYMLSEIRYLLLTEQTQELCGKNAVTLIYFYSNNDCNDCASQGLILTNLKDQFDNKLLIFSLDADFAGEPIIDILQEQFGITQTPSVVINGKTYSGLKTAEELQPIICSKLPKDTEECKTK